LRIQDQAELLAADPEETVGLAPVLLDQHGQLPQGVVADGVAEAVVDALEVVDVEHGQAEAAPVADLLAQFQVEQFLELAPIVDAGERVGAGQQFQALLDGLAAADLGLQPFILVAQADRHLLEQEAAVLEAGDDVLLAPQQQGGDRHQGQDQDGGQEPDVELALAGVEQEVEEGLAGPEQELLDAGVKQPEQDRADEPERQFAQRGVSG
jgi:hypothetical protein